MPAIATLKNRNAKRVRADDEDEAPAKSKKASTEKESKHGSFEVTMRVFKVHSATTQYREVDEDGDFVETADAAVGPAYLRTKKFRGSTPKEITVTVAW